MIIIAPTYDDIRAKDDLWNDPQICRCGQGRNTMSSNYVISPHRGFIIKHDRLNLMKNMSQHSSLCLI